MEDYIRVYIINLKGISFIKLSVTWKVHTRKTDDNF